MTQEELIRLKASPEWKAAEELEKTVNNFSFSPKRLAESISCWHPTLAQAFGRVIKEYIVIYADDDRHYDLRTKGLHEMAKEFKKVAEESHLPFI